MNYTCTIRTNYFHVIDPDAFREFMSKVEGLEDKIRLFEDKDEDGNSVFGFGVYGGIFGYVDRTPHSPATDEADAPEPIADTTDEDEDDEIYDDLDFDDVEEPDVPEDDEEIDPDAAYQDFLNGIQHHLAPDDACIIFEAGNEGLRYVVGSATVITKDDMTSLDIDFYALRLARKMLGNEDWETKTCY